MKLLKTVLVPAIAVLAISAGAAFAQTTPAPAPATPAPAMKAKPRTAASLACSTAADKQNIHGTSRKKFMSDCNKMGGPAN